MAIKKSTKKILGIIALLLGAPMLLNLVIRPTSGKWTNDAGVDVSANFSQVEFGIGSATMGDWRGTYTNFGRRINWVHAVSGLKGFWVKG